MPYNIDSLFCIIINDVNQEEDKQPADDQMEDKQLEDDQLEPIQLNDLNQMANNQGVEMY